MRVALIAPPFIPVPPPLYGGTELFIAQLACGLRRRDIEVVVYTNGESTVDVERRWMYAKGRWPIREEVYYSLMDVNHTAWAVADAAKDCDIIHLNNVPGLVHTLFVDLPFVYTVHHPVEESVTSMYELYQSVHYVTISDFQRHRMNLPQVRTIHHGIELAHYELKQSKKDYVAFLGRIAPMKGTHVAIEVAKRSGIPLKIAGEVQPLFREYYDTQVKPHVDGKFIEYVGPADLNTKNELLGNACAMLFPVSWNEPFGLTMIESMACGTPVLAFPGGAVGEIVRDGVSGRVCSSVEDMVERVKTVSTEFNARDVRSYVAQNFSTEVMAAKYAALYSELIKKSAATAADSSGTHPFVA